MRKLDEQTEQKTMEFTRKIQAICLEYQTEIYGTLFINGYILDLKMTGVYANVQWPNWVPDSDVGSRTPLVHVRVVRS